MAVHWKQSIESELISQLIMSCPEKFSEALFSALIISERLLNDILKPTRAKLTANNYSDEMSRKLSEVVEKVVQADPGKMGAILEVVSKFSPEELEQSGGRLSFTDYLCTVSIDTDLSDLCRTLWGERE